MIPNFNQQPQLITVLVQGEANANSYPVGIGNTVLLMDFEGGKFWIKTNPNGIRQPPRSFSFTETTPQPINQNRSENLVTREEFNALNSKLDKLLAELGGAK